MPLNIPDSLIAAEATKMPPAEVRQQAPEDQGLARALVALALGLPWSNGMGEQGGWFAQGNVQAGPMDGTVTYDAVPKYTGKGYSVRGTGDVHLPGPFLAGLEYSHRNGGDWTKQALRGRVGVEQGPLSLTYQKDLKQTGGQNDQSAIKARLREDIPLTDQLALRLLMEYGAHRYQPTDQPTAPHRWGHTLDTGVGLTWGGRQ